MSCPNTLCNIFHFVQFTPLSFCLCLTPLYDRPILAFLLSWNRFDVVSGERTAWLLGPISNTERFYEELQRDYATVCLMPVIRKLFGDITWFVWMLMNVFHVFCSSMARQGEVLCGKCCRRIWCTLASPQSSCRWVFECLPAIIDKPVSRAYKMDVTCLRPTCIRLVFQSTYPVLYGL